MSSLTRLQLINKVNSYITTNATKDITAAKTREILTDIINAFDGSNVLDEATLDMSDITVYNANTRELTIPSGQPFPYIGKFTLTATPFYIGGTYAQYEVVKSDGLTDGGVLDKCYRSKVNTNLGNLLSDATKWEFADAPGGNVGNIEIVKVNNYSTEHTIQFEPEPTQLITVTIVATPTGSIAAGQIALDQNVSVILSGYGFIILQPRGSILRKIGGGLLN